MHIYMVKFVIHLLLENGHKLNLIPCYLIQTICIGYYYLGSGTRNCRILTNSKCEIYLYSLDDNKSLKNESGMTCFLQVFSYHLDTLMFSN